MIEMNRIQKWFKKRKEDKRHREFVKELNQMFSLDKATSYIASTDDLSWVNREIDWIGRELDRRGKCTRNVKLYLPNGKQILVIMTPEE